MVVDKSLWLINLPHAGGSTAVFKKWNKKIKCNILNVEYPGHWTRIKEPMLNSFPFLANDVINEIEKNVPQNSNIMLFGHSVGAIMAWYITPILMSKGFKICKLFLSGSQNPGAFPEKSIIMSTSDSDMLRLIGYRTEEHEESINAQFMNTFLPILKNDMMVCKSFVCDGHFVDISSIVLYGTSDIFTDLYEMQKWGKYVLLKSMIGYPGGHLFIDEKENVESITELINNSIITIEKGLTE